MFHDLDDTLKRVLDDTAAPTVLQEADVSFETPEKNYAPFVATINLFLYEVRENRELRDPIPVVERVGDVIFRRRSPLRVDCSYMVTAWSNQVGAAKIVEEHRLLSQALLWLSRFPTIPPTYLQGSLASQPFPPPNLVAQMDDSKSAVGEFWTALGTPPRPTFNLVATIAMELGVEVSEGPPVVTKEMRLLDERWFQIAGRVSEAANPSNLINAAQIRLVETNQTLLTNTQGEFTFSELLAGNYTLEVSKAGFANQSKVIVVPTPIGGSANAYDVALTP
jgi:Pvc16 N-terminal domain/Carboxypeptidase regulatory-like domain